MTKKSAKPKLINKAMKSQQNKAVINMNEKKGSSTVIKNLTQSVITTIIYLTNIVPEHCFHQKGFGLKTQLLEVDNDAIPIPIYKSIKHGLKTFDRKYLQKMVVYFYNAPEFSMDNLVLFTVFEYTYFTNSKTRNLLGYRFEDIQKKHQKFLLSCMSLVDYCPCLRCNECLVDFNLYLNKESPEAFNAVGYVGSFEYDKLPRLRKQYHVVAQNKFETNFHAVTITVYSKEVPFIAEK